MQKARRKAPTPEQTFVWLTALSVLGVLLAVPMRRHFVVDEKLPFPDGIAAAETLKVLDPPRGSAKGVKPAAPDHLTMSLFAPGMTALHRAGLGGLACTLKAMERQYEAGLIRADKLPGPMANGAYPWEIAAADFLPVATVHRSRRAIVPTSL